MNPSINIVFDLDKNSGTYGKWLFTDTTDYAGLGINPNNVVGWLVINFPNGGVYSGSSSAPDILPGTSTTNSVIGIPLDANAHWLQGNYSFQYFILVNGTDQFSTATTYNFCPKFKFLAGDEGSLSAETDCFRYRINVKDRTNYGTPTSKSTTITLYPPQPLIDSGDATVVTSNSSSLVYVFGYTGTYVAELSTLVTYALGNVSVVGRVTADKDISVQCSINICALIACYNKMLRKLSNQLANGAYLDSVDNALKTDMILASLYLWNFKESAACGNYTAATAAYDKLKALLGCDCDCSDTPNISDDIRLVNPDFSPEASNLYNVLGTSPVVVVPNTVGNETIFDVSLSQGFLDSLAASGTSITTLQTNVSSLQLSVSNLQSSVTNILSQVPVLLYGTATSEGTVIGSATQALLDDYTLPANTLGVNGDIIKIEATLFSNTAIDAGVEVSIMLGAIKLASFKRLTRGFVYFDVNVIRTAVANQYVYSIAQQGGSLVFNLTSSELQQVDSYVKSVYRTINLANDNLLQILCEKGSGNFTASEILATSLTVKHFKK
jgi:hypothetical protein